MTGKKLPLQTPKIRNIEELIRRTPPHLLAERSKKHLNINESASTSHLIGDINTNLGYGGSSLPLQDHSLCPRIVPQEGETKQFLYLPKNLSIILKGSTSSYEEGTPGSSGTGHQWPSSLGGSNSGGSNSRTTDHHPTYPLSNFYPVVPCTNVNGNWNNSGHQQELLRLHSKQPAVRDQELPQLPSSYQELPPLPSSYQELPPLPSSYQELPPLPSSFQELVPLPPYVSSYQELPPMPSSYQELPPLPPSYGSSYQELPPLPPYGSSYVVNATSNLEWSSVLGNQPAGRDQEVPPLPPYGGSYVANTTSTTLESSSVLGNQPEGRDHELPPLPPYVSSYVANTTSTLDRSSVLGKRPAESNPYQSFLQPPAMRQHLGAPETGSDEFIDDLFNLVQSLGTPAYISCWDKVFRSGSWVHGHGPHHTSSVHAAAGTSGTAPEPSLTLRLGNDSTFDNGQRGPTRKRESMKKKKKMETGQSSSKRTLDLDGHGSPKKTE